MRNGDRDEPFDGDDDIDIEGLPDTEVDVECPWCGETVSISIDPWGGHDQVYTEDCEVCCQPWRVHVTIDDDNNATVQIDQEE